MQEKLPRRVRRVAEQTFEVLRRTGWEECPDDARALTMAGLHSWRFARKPYGAMVSIDDDGSFTARIGLGDGDPKSWPTYRSTAQFFTAVRVLASES